MHGLEYIYELCEKLPRSGPGDNTSTRRAFMSIPDIPEHPNILDIGCGQGMQTLELARICEAEIIALDNHQGFLDILSENAKQEGLDTRIIPMLESMEDMRFENNSFDIIWSEGALYSMGFYNGLDRCYELLKPGACLAATELVYIKEPPPGELKEFFNNEYPVIKTINQNIEQIQQTDYTLLDHFTLPSTAWMDNYFIPIEQQLPQLLDKYSDNPTALEIYHGFQQEIDMYRRYGDFYGYEFFILKKT